MQKIHVVSNRSIDQTDCPKVEQLYSGLSLIQLCTNVFCLQRPESKAQVTATRTGFSLRSCRYVQNKKSPKNDEQTKAHAEYIQCFLCDAHLSANTPPPTHTLNSK